MTFLSPYVLPVAQVVWGVEIHSIPHVIWKSIFDTSSNLSAKKQIDDCLHRSIFIYFCWLFIFWFFNTLSATSFELADKVIENQKEVHRMTFLSPYVLPVAQVVWGVEIHSIPHVIWKSISWHLIQFERQKTDRWLPSPIYFYLFLLVIYFWFFQLPYQQLPWSWLIR